jgi:adenylosuccinate synthase
MKDNPIQLEYLKFVLLSQLTLEANENLYFTQQYRQQIKNLGKRLNNELESVVRDEYQKVYNTDREMTTNILRSMEELVQKIAKSTIDDMVLLNAIIDKYKDNKEWFLEHANAEFLKLDI